MIDGLLRRLAMLEGSDENGTFLLPDPGRDADRAEIMAAAMRRHRCKQVGFLLPKSPDPDDFI